MDQKKKEPNSTAATPAAESGKEINEKAVKMSEEDLAPKGWIKPNRDILENAAKREAKSDDVGDALRIVFGTSGEYPDGTKWERDATEEEAEQYNEWMQ